MIWLQNRTWEIWFLIFSFCYSCPEYYVSKQKIQCFSSKVKMKNIKRGQHYPAGRLRSTSSVWPCPSCLLSTPLCLLGAEGCCKPPSWAEDCRDRHTAFCDVFHQLWFLPPSLETVLLVYLWALLEIFPESNRFCFWGSWDTAERTGTKRWARI